MSLKIVRVNFLKNGIYKHLYSKLFVPFPNGLRNVASYNFHSNNNEGNNKNYNNLIFGIGGSVGIAILLGILNLNKKTRTNGDSIIEKMKQKFTLLAATNQNNLVSPRATYNFLADVVEKTQNSVVYIEIRARHPLTRREIPVSNGSGFIIKADGLILTNAHVVNHYGHVVVKLYDGREFKGIVENIDSESDLATVRISTNNLPELPLGRSSDLRPGEFVIAMGNPLTLSHTITAGVVSSVNRPSKDLGLHKDTNYIQTDAAIHIGNSGGPLVNLDGEAIGINTMKVTEGISFAVSSDCAIEFLKKTENQSSWNPFRKSRVPNKVKFLGLGMMTLSPNIIKNLKERNPDFPSVNHGILVWKIVIDSPSYECGIRPGDVITKINGKDVYTAEAVQPLLEKEDSLNLTIHRGQKKFEVSVKLVETDMP